jgi:hypothetical protein
MSQAAAAACMLVVSTHVTVTGSVAAQHVDTSARSCMHMLSSCCFSQGADIRLMCNQRCVSLNLQACAAVAIALGAAAHFMGVQHSKQATSGTTTNSRVDGPAVAAAAAAAAAHADVADFDDSVRPLTAEEHCKDNAGSYTKPSSQTSSCSSRRQQQHQQDQSPRNTADSPAVTLHIESSIEGNLQQQQQQQQQHEDAALKLQRQRSIQLGDNSRFLGLALAISGECFLCALWLRC